MMPGDDVAILERLIDKLEEIGGRNVQLPAGDHECADKGGNICDDDEARASAEPPPGCRGETRKRSGPMPMASMASTSSATVMVPSSAV